MKAKLSLSERTYKCDGCGLVMDRDLNAAININVAGSAPETKNAHGGTGSRNDLSGHATQDPLKCEPSCGDSRVRLGAGGRKQDSYGLPTGHKKPVTAFLCPRSSDY